MHISLPQEPELCRSCWLRITQRDVELNPAAAHEGEWRWQLAAAGACGILGVAGWFLAGAGNGPALACNLAAYLAGAWFAAGEMWEKLRDRQLDVHFLMLAVAAGAAAIGEWSEGVVLLFLFSFAGALEHFAMERTQREIRSLIDTAPKTASLVLSDGSQVEVSVGQLRPGHTLRLLPGALVPVDGELVAGETAVDESTLTGEAAPVEKRTGDAVLAGTVNGWGRVDVRVLRPAEESALQKIIRLIRDAQRQKAPSQRFTDRFGSGYTMAVLALTLAMFFVWWLVAGREPFAAGGPRSSAFYQAMTLLVVASPCALVLSVPSAILAAIAAGARRGILFRGGVAVEQLAEIELVAMDKTGTLTTGELRVESVESFPPGRETEVAELAYALERLSTHPLARAVAGYGKKNRLGERELSSFASVTGCGLQAETGGAPVRLGRRSWVFEVAGGGAFAAPGEGERQGEEALFSEVWVASAGLLGRLRLRDELRPESRAVVESLHLRGLRTIVLTGDRAGAAAFLRQALAVQEVRAELKPEEKLGYIVELSRSGKHAAMIGDGINDAPSLAAAHVGVAMGARGADAALEQADVVLMHDRLENFLRAYDLSVAARRIIRQNVAVSLGVIALLVGFALAGRIPLTLGVLGHEGSTLLVVLNSLRLLVGDTSPETKRG
jgi:Cd2+/Zn2+-exporting ATPase